MTEFEWNESFSVHNSDIDEQHKKLFDLINQFYDQIDLSSPKELILHLISGLKEYTIMHFHFEEEHMRNIHYAMLPEHKKEHDDLIAKVNELEKKLKSGRLLFSFEITELIKDWIKNHILDSDLKFAQGKL